MGNLKKLILMFLICLTAPLFLSSQPYYFNNMYDSSFSGTWGVAKSLLETDDGYLIGSMTGGTNDYWYRIAICKLDIYGTEEWTKTWGADNTQYWLGHPGSFINTDDGGYLMCGTFKNNVVIDAGLIVMLDENCDTVYTRFIWDGISPVNYYYYLMQCLETKNGFVFIGTKLDVNNSYHNVLYLLKTDKFGNMLSEWLYAYPNSNYILRGFSVIETPDKGFALGAYRFKPGYAYTGEPMVYKVDSLGNVQWHIDVGGPYSDDITMLCNAHDGNIIAATCSADSMSGSDDAFRRVNIKKLDLEGNVIWDFKYGHSKLYHYIGNLRQTNDGGYIVTGSMATASLSGVPPWESGWVFKINGEGDSLWYRFKYNLASSYDENFLYDIIPTNDNGFAACGEVFGPTTGYTQHAWVVKMDSMGCDTLGCATGTHIPEISPSGGGQGEELLIWPNPTKNKFEVWNLPAGQAGSKFGVGGNKIIRVYNSQGVKVEEIIVPENTQSLTVDVEDYENGLYFIQLINSNTLVGSAKIIKE